MIGAAKLKIKLVLLATIIAFAVLCALWLYVFPSGRPPREESLLAKFSAHRTTYESLRNMLLEDEEVSSIYARFGVETRESGLPRSPSEVNFPVNRYNEYLIQLNQIDSSEVFRSGENDSAICIVAWASGFGGDTRHVNICSLPNRPVNQVASLEEFYKTPKPRHPVYRHIDDDWYLWADW